MSGQHLGFSIYYKFRHTHTHTHTHNTHTHTDTHTKPSPVCVDKTLQKVYIHSRN